jgi:hypothetical protein
MIMESVSKVIGFFTEWGHEVEKTMVGVLTDFSQKSFRPRVLLFFKCVHFYFFTLTHFLAFLHILSIFPTCSAVT